MIAVFSSYHCNSRTSLGGRNCTNVILWRQCHAVKCIVYVHRSTDKANQVRPGLRFSVSSRPADRQTHADVHSFNQTQKETGRYINQSIAE